jgi:ABC-2 type transport system ATP-binding protein
VIRVENLTKYYGELQAISDLNFEVKDGEILGFLGPNGAGKSTTLKIITTFLTPSNGRVTVNDMEIGEFATEIRSLIGYLPEFNPLYPEMTVYDQLAFAASVRGIEGRKFKEALGRVMEVCGLRNVIHRPISELSRGFRQRVGLAVAIIHDPEILILDEPSSGLDPNQIVEIRELIKELGREKTVIMSSHILKEVEAVADRMVILNNGQMVANGTTPELMAGFKGKAQLLMEIKGASVASVNNLVTKVPDVLIEQTGSKEGITSLSLEYPTGHDLREAVFQYAVDNNWVILEMTRKQTQLEDVFRSLTVENGGANA